jgi:hypothetical protein
MLHRGEKGETKITYLNNHGEPYKFLPLYLNIGRTNQYSFIPQILSKEDILIFSYEKLNRMKWAGEKVSTEKLTD